MANRVVGPDRRGGVKPGTNWTEHARIYWRIALEWRRVGRPDLFQHYAAEALKIIAKHSRNVVCHVQALELLDKLEAGR